MTPEERFDRIERQMEFIVHQQGKFYADLRKLDERADRTSEQIERNSGQIQQVTDLLFRTGRVVEELARESDGRWNRLVEAQQHTDKRLNILIDVVERYFSDGNHS